MKAYFSIIVFAVLLSSAVVTGTGNYIDARERIASDLNHALVRALAEKGQEWVTADTIRVCRQLQAVSSDDVALCFRDDCFDRNLSIPELRGKSYVSFLVITGDGGDCGALSGAEGVSGDTVIWKSGAARNSNVSIAFRGNASCSFATVLGCSDQKMPVTFALMALVWGTLSLSYMRRRRGMEVVHADLCKVGSMSYDRSARVFYDADNNRIRFTPMQFTLMEMFFNADGNQLSKAEICDALWPGKDDPSETLYTLIRRLKVVVGQNTNLSIEVERGRAYRLKVSR